MATLKLIQSTTSKTILRMVLLGLISLGGLTACQNFYSDKTIASPIDQEVYASLLTQQCQSVSTQQDQLRIQQLSNYLQQHGIAVKAYSLGLDGKMRIQQCGSADGRGVIFRIATQDMELAKTLGFVSVTKDTVRLLGVDH